MATNNSINGPFSVTPTASTISQWDANKNHSANCYINGYATTATAATTTTLTVASSQQQFFTGSTTQTVSLPVTSTLVLGQSFYIVNNSSGLVTVNSSGGNAVKVMGANTTLLVTCISTSGTTAASWNADYSSASSGANFPVNTNITSMTGLTGVIQAPTAIASAAGLNCVAFSYIANAVNGITFQNNSTGNNPAIIASGTDPNITLQIQGTGTGGVYLVGASTNSDAVTGQVGEYVSSHISNGSPTTVTANTQINLTSISLTAGDWDVWGNVSFVTLGTACSQVYAQIGLTSATFTDQSFYNTIATTTGILATPIGLSAPQIRVSIATTTTVYMITYMTVSSGNGTACGGLYARRVR